MDELLNLAKDINNLQTIQLDEMPDIYLYMDQVTKLMEDKLNGYKRDDEQKIMTKTMINNYTKDKLLPSPEKKKYNKEHIMHLSLIYNLKSVLSICDIKEVLVGNEDIEKLYLSFDEIKNTDTFMMEVEQSLETLAKIDDEKLKAQLMVVSLINEANKRKILAEKIIDTYLKN